MNDVGRSAAQADWWSKLELDRPLCLRTDGPVATDCLQLRYHHAIVSTFYLLYVAIEGNTRVKTDFTQ